MVLPKHAADEAEERHHDDSAVDNVGIVVEDLDAAIAFFTELGMEREGKAQIEGL